MKTRNAAITIPLFLLVSFGLQAQVTLTAGDGKGAPDKVVKVAIAITESAKVGGPGNMRFEVTHDPAVVKVAGDIYPKGALFDANGAESGRIRIAVASKEALSKEGILAHIPFQVMGEAGQETALTVKMVECHAPDGTAIVPKTQDGKISVSPSP